MVAPGPPAPPPPPAPSASASDGMPSRPPSNMAGRSALLKSINKGTKLKKTSTNDRSAPVLASGSSSSNAANSSSSGGGGGGGPLGGLFAGGMPKLRSTGGKHSTGKSEASSSSSNSLVKEPTVKEKFGAAKTMAKMSITGNVSSKEAASAASVMGRSKLASMTKTSASKEEATSTSEAAVPAWKSALKKTQNAVTGGVAVVGDKVRSKLNSDDSLSMKSTATQSTAPPTRSTAPVVANQSMAPAVAPRPHINSGTAKGNGRNNPPPVPSAKSKPPPVPPKRKFVSEKTTENSNAQQTATSSMGPQINMMAMLGRQPSSSPATSDSNNNPQQTRSARWPFRDELPPVPRHNGRTEFSYLSTLMTDEDQGSSQSTRSNRSSSSSTEEIKSKLARSLAQKETELYNCMAVQDFERCITVKEEIKQLQDLQQQASDARSGSSLARIESQMQRLSL